MSMTSNNYETIYKNNCIKYVINDVDTRKVCCSVKMDMYTGQKIFSIYAFNDYIGELQLRFCNSFEDAKKQFIKLIQTKKQQSYFSELLSKFILRDTAQEDRYLIDWSGI